MSRLGFHTETLAVTCLTATALRPRAAAFLALQLDQGPIGPDQPEYTPRPPGPPGRPAASPAGPPPGGRASRAAARSSARNSAAARVTPPLRPLRPMPPGPSSPGRPNHEERGGTTTNVRGLARSARCPAWAGRPDGITGSAGTRARTSRTVPPPRPRAGRAYPRRAPAPRPAPPTGRPGRPPAPRPPPGPSRPAGRPAASPGGRSQGLAQRGRVRSAPGRHRVNPVGRNPADVFGGCLPRLRGPGGRTCDLVHRPLEDGPEFGPVVQGPLAPPGQPRRSHP